MSTPVKTKRPYRSKQRAEQAADTRRAVVRAARDAFVASGWDGTTIAGVARAAKVSPETIYSVFGSKAALFTEAVRSAVRRSDPDTPLIEQAKPRAVTEAPDQASILKLFARDIAGVLSNVAPLMAVAAAAAPTNPDIDRIYRELHAGRRNNLRQVSEALIRRGPLRGGLGPDDATDIIWRLVSPELFLLVTKVEGVEIGEYAAWLERTLVTLLLPE